MSDLKFRFRGKHRKDCIAMEYVRRDDWSSPWYLTGAESRNASGVARGHHRWLVFGCNTALSHPCPAELLLEETSLVNSLPNTKPRGG